MSEINWGIIGLGKIANKFALGFKDLKNAKLLSVASRNKKNLNEFQSKFNLNNNFSSSLEETKCFVTDCENLIASDGSILISSNQINEKKLNEFPDNLIILSDTMKFKNTISEGLSEIKSKSKKIPTNITTIKNFNVIKEDKDFLSYGTSSKNLYLILL